MPLMTPSNPTASARKDLWQLSSDSKAWFSRFISDQWDPAVAAIVFDSALVRGSQPNRALGVVPSLAWGPGPPFKVSIPEVSSLSAQALCALLLYSKLKENGQLVP